MSRTAIDRAEVRRIARLARLELDEADVDVLSSQLASILDYVAMLDELDLVEVPPTSHRLSDAGHALREDAPSPGLGTAEALANAPDAADGHFRVPRVLAE